MSIQTPSKKVLKEIQTKHLSWMSEEESNEQILNLIKLANKLKLQFESIEELVFFWFMLSDNLCATWLNTVPGSFWNQLIKTTYRDWRLTGQS